MTKRSLLMAVTALVAAAGSAAAVENTPMHASAGTVQPISRVRSDNPVVLRAIREGADRSATFRSLVETVNSSDGIVWVQEGRCGHSVRACLVLSITMAGPNRLLRILVDTRRSDHDLIGSIGHELRHALEVLGDATVNSDGAIYLLYRRIGETSGDRFETEAAIHAGNVIRAELRR
jgi:hypothetical protein